MTVSEFKFFHNWSKKPSLCDNNTKSLPSLLKRWKLYHLPCNQNDKWRCFFCEYWICMCTQDHHSDYFFYNGEYGTCDYCQNNGVCFRQDPYINWWNFVCLYPKCSYGTLRYVNWYWYENRRDFMWLTSNNCLSNLGVSSSYFDHQFYCICKQETWTSGLWFLFIDSDYNQSNRFELPIFTISLNDYRLNQVYHTWLCVSFGFIFSAINR